MYNCPTRLLALVLLLFISSTAAADPTLRGIDLGSHAAGPEINVGDLRGRVVVVEYWGITCPPCLAAIPHTTELAKKYGHDKLIIIANQVWGASDRQCKETWEKRAKSNFVAVYNGGKVEGFSPRGVPSCVIFDHEGKFVWQGHPSGMDRVLAQAVARVPARSAEDKPDEAGGPEPIVTDLQPKYYEREVEQINEQQRPFGRTLARLSRDAERDSEQGKEAAAILKAVDAWAIQQSSDMTSASSDDPATAYAIAERASGLLRGDDRAEPFIKLIQTYERDAATMDQVRSMTLLREVEAKAKSIGLSEDPAASHAERENGRTILEVQRDLQRIVGAWPETEAGKRAVQLLEEWKLELE